MELKYQIHLVYINFQSRRLIFWILLFVQGTEKTTPEYINYSEQGLIIALKVRYSSWKNVIRVSDSADHKFSTMWGMFFDRYNYYSSTDWFFLYSFISGMSQSIHHRDRHNYCYGNLTIESAWTCSQMKCRQSILYCGQSLQARWTVLVAAERTLLSLTKHRRIMVLWLVSIKGWSFSKS